VEPQEALEAARHEAGRAAARAAAQADARARRPQPPTTLAEVEAAAREASSDKRGRAQASATYTGYMASLAQRGDVDGVAQAFHSMQVRLAAWPV